MKKLTENRLAKEKKSDKISLIQRGYSLMAKLQPSKLIMRVRFPLPAASPTTPRPREEGLSFIGISQCKCSATVGNKRGEDDPEAMNKERKALLLSAGYGKGHHAAAWAMAEELRHRGWQATVSDPCAEDRPGLFRLTQLFYRTCVRRAPWLWGLVYEQIDTADWSQLIHLPGIADCMRGLRARLQNQQPDLVLCTYPLYAYMLDAFALEGWFRTPYAVIVTDALAISRPWLQTRAPLICLTDEHSLAEVQDRYAPAPERLAAPGFPVHAAFTPGKERPTPRPDGEGLHVVYGGHAPISRVCADVQAMVQAMPRIRITLLADGQEKRLNTLLSEYVSCGRVKLCPSNQDMATLLHRAHLYIGKAGAATLFEAYAAEVPVLINSAMPGQEEGNLRLLMKDKAGQYVASPAELALILRRLVQNDAAAWRRMCSAMRSAHRSGGAARTADVLEGRFFS